MTLLYDMRPDPEGGEESVLVEISAEELYGPLDDYKKALRTRVNAIRDQRISGGFAFLTYRIQSRATDRENILALAAQAAAAIAAGAEVGDYTWGGLYPAGFGFIVEDNSVIPIDAQTMVAMRDRGFDFKAGQTFYAVSLKAAVDAAADHAAAAAVIQGATWPE